MEPILSITPMILYSKPARSFATSDEMMLRASTANPAPHAAQQSVSSRTNLRRSTNAGTAETIAQKLWDDPDPPLQKAIARGEMIEMMRMLWGGDVDPNTIGDSWGTAMDAAGQAPWESAKRDDAFRILRKHGVLFLSELLEEATGDKHGETEDHQIDADHSPISVEIDHWDFRVRQSEAELEEGTGNKQGETGDHLTDADHSPISVETVAGEFFFLHREGRFRDTPNPWDRSRAMAPRPQTPEFDMDADLASTASTASTPSRRQPPPNPATPGTYTIVLPKIDKQVRIREDIFQIQSALASFGYRYHALGNPVHYRILALFARGHPNAAMDFPRTETRSLREILDDLTRWETSFQSDTKSSDTTFLSNPSRLESQPDEKHVAERIKSTDGINIERFRDIQTIEFPKHVLPHHLVLRLHRPLQDDPSRYGLGGGENSKIEGMTWDNFVYTMLLIRTVITTFDQDTTSDRNGFKSFQFEDFVLTMMEIVELQTVIPPDSATTNAFADGESVLGESLVEAMNGSMY